MGKKYSVCVCVYNNQINNNNREFIGNNRNSANNEYLVICSMESQCSCLRRGLLCSTLQDLRTSLAAEWSDLICNSCAIGNCSSLISTEQELTSVLVVSSVRYWQMKFARPISVYAALLVLMCYMFDTI